MKRVTTKPMLSLLAVCTALSNVPAVVMAQSSNPAPLQLETTIPLGDVRGRIDHMAADTERRRLFVAELGNDTVGIVDLEQHKVLKRLTGLKEPQGIGYLRSADTLYVANGSDGSVRIYQGADYAERGRIDLGSDADNVRVDEAHQQIVVGYGGGALAVIDAAARSKIADIALHGHPESFQLAVDAGRAYVNVPNARGIAVADLPTRKQIATWTTGDAAANFPMALDGQSKRVLSMFRNPAKLGAFDMRDGDSVAMVDACGDADDLFLDDKRRRIYVSCGAGAVDVFDAQSYRHLSRIPTSSGARTSLFIAESDRLYVAARVTGGNPAAILVLRPPSP